MKGAKNQCSNLFTIGVITSILIFLFMIVIIINKFDPIIILSNLGEPCYNDNECISGLKCYDGLCLGNNGMTCNNNNDCGSSSCYQNVCQ